MNILQALERLAYYLVAPPPDGSGALSFTHYYYPYAVKLPDGVYYNADERELQKLTINDNQGSYFYLRLNGEPRYTRPTQRVSGGCNNEQQMTIPVRLVLLCNEVSHYQAEALIRQAISNDSSSVLGAQTDIQLQSVAFDKISILPQEGYNTDADPAFLLQPQLQLLAINLQLTIPAINDCETIDLCAPPGIIICPPSDPIQPACPDECIKIIDQVSDLAWRNEAAIATLTTNVDEISDSIDTLAKSADVATLLNIDTSADYRLLIAAPTGLILTTLQYVLGATVVDYALVVDGTTEFSTTGLTGSGSIVINQVIASGNEARVLLTNIATPEAQVELQHNYTQSV